MKNKGAQGTTDPLSFLVLLFHTVLRVPCRLWDTLGKGFHTMLLPRSSSSLLGCVVAEGPNGRGMGPRIESAEGKRGGEERREGRELMGR